jgi:hypothetical protein
VVDVVQEGEDGGTLRDGVLANLHFGVGASCQSKVGEAADAEALLDDGVRVRQLVLIGKAGKASAPNNLGPVLLMRYFLLIFF